MKYLLDIHCHSVASGHAYSSITENVNYAKNIGLELIAITDHAPKMIGSCDFIYFLNLGVLPSNINGVEVLKGVELNILDDDANIDLKPAILDKLDLRIASLHIPCIEPTDDTKINNKRILNAMENPYINIIGHLGDPRYPIEIDEIIKKSIQTKTLIEINNTSLSPNNSRVGSDIHIEKILNRCKKFDCPVVFGSDAHYHTYIGNFDDIEILIEKTNFPEDLILNTSIEKFKKFI